VVKDVLRHLGSLATARRALDHGDLVALYGAYDLQVRHKAKVKVRNYQSSDLNYITIKQVDVYGQYIVGCYMDWTLTFFNDFL